MTLTEQTWKERAAAKLRHIKQWLKGEAPYLAYGTVAGLSIWPLLEAAANTPPGTPLAASLYIALGSVAGGVGSDLIAEQLQRWRDRAGGVTEAEVAQWVRDNVTALPELRQALDNILEKLESIPQAQAALEEPDRAWFQQTLQAELARLGNLERFQAVLGAGSALAVGEGARATAVAERGVNVPGYVAGSIVTGKWVQGTYVETQIITAEGGSDPEALRLAYLNRVLVSSSQLSLAGIDPKAASEAEMRLNLGAVYTALLTQSSELEAVFAGRILGHRQRAAHASVLAQLERQPRLVLLGDPGSGKSTFVNFVSLCLAGELLDHPQANLSLLTAPLPDENGNDEEETQPWTHGALLPVRVVLRDLVAQGLPPVGKKATAATLWHFIENELASAALDDYAPHLKQTLLKQGGLLLLDGLDEVPEAEERRAQIKAMVEDFAGTFPRCRVLVTSRTYAYQKQEWRLSGFAEAVLAPFSEGQIRRFARRWYAHIGPLRGLSAADAQGRAELLQRAIFASDRLQALAERPLLLTLMASLHAWRGGSLPEKREELYADAVNLLLDWWESPKVVRDEQGQVTVLQPSLAEWLKVDRDKVRQLLNELSYQAHGQQPELTGTADVGEGDLVTGLLHLSQNPDAKPARLIEYLSQRAGLLLPRGEGVYTFPHRTFQEYLAACYLTDADFPDQVAALAQQEPNRWREVVLLAGAKAARGSAANIWTLAEALCYREPEQAGSNLADVWGAQLAGQALAETADLGRVSERHQDKVGRAQRWLAHILRSGQLPAVERALAGRSLAKLGDPRPEVTDVDEMRFCYVPPGPFWMGEGQEEHLNESLDKGYWIDRFPVTQAHFDQFVKDSGYGRADFWPEARRERYWGDDGFKGRYDSEWRQAPYGPGEPFTLSNHPVVGITWYEALAFSRWLEARWRQKGIVPETWRVQLASEAEWEKAARGGLRLPAAPVVRAIREVVAISRQMAADGRPPPVENKEAKAPYPWGDEAHPDRANYDASEIGTTSSVGAFPLGASPYGCEEMSGNVWEWMRSHYRHYPYAPEDGREEAATVEKFTGTVLRGGAYYSGSDHLRCSFRFRYSPYYHDDDIGFRLVAASPLYL